MQTTNWLKHLYNRAAFGLSLQEWQNRQNWSVAQAVEHLFQNAIPTILPVNAPEQRQNNKTAKLEIRKMHRMAVIQQNYEWIKRMANVDENAFLERMTLFWHGHFASESKAGFLAAQQLNTIQKYALGSFRELILAISRDSVMIRYLNNQQNRKNQPNENFARELMELFTIGRGNYSEKDIKEAARAFTGWTSNFKGEFIFRKKHHDYGLKSFFGKTGHFNGEDIIDLILEKKETAQFITRKIYRYFVNEKVDEERITELSNRFYDSNYHIGDLMHFIFSSDWFYAPENQGTKIKSPLDFLVGMIRQFQLKSDSHKDYYYVQRALGQILFKPPNVAGWPGGKNWIDNSTLMVRLNLLTTILQVNGMEISEGSDLEGDGKKKKRRLNLQVDFTSFYTLTKGMNEHEIAQTLQHYLISPQIAISKETLLEFSKAKNREEFIKKCCVRLTSLPEYQMC